MREAGRLASDPEGDDGGGERQGEEPGPGAGGEEMRAADNGQRDALLSADCGDVALAGGSDRGISGQTR
jgi:hypothetical protein